jgi:outer membrane protein insertion porin family
VHTEINIVRDGLLNIWNHLKFIGEACWLVLFIFAGLLVQQGYAQDTDEREPIVWTVSFEGNESYSGVVLREIIATQSPSFIQKITRRTGDFVLNEMDLRRDQVRLRRYYERRGYHNISVQYEVSSKKKEWKKSIIFKIDENAPLIIESTSVVIETEDDREEILQSREFERAIENHEFRSGKNYQTIRMPDVEGRFLGALENLGYAWPELEIRSDIDSLANSVNVEIVAKTGPKTYFENILVDGELSVPERIVVRHTGIDPGDMYTGDILQQAQRQLFGHHLIRFATISIPEQERDSTLNIQIRVREHPLRSVQATVGFGREELLRGQLSWQHRNINGRAHRFGVSGRASFIEQRLGNDYLIPYIFNAKSSNVSSIFGLHKLEPSFELFQAGFNNSFIYQARRNVTGSATYEFTINEEMSRDQDVALPDSITNYNISSLSFSGYYSQGLSREPRGWVIQPFVELSGTFGEASFKFQKLSLDVRRYTPITNSLTFAARVNSGVIFYTQPDSLPGNIRFFSGGTNSVRGWNRQTLGPQRPSFDDDGDFSGYVPIGGRAMVAFNAELRQQLTGFIPNLGLAAFLDGGQVWRAVDRVGERPIQFGAGGGIRYQSPIGPVRVDVAYKLNPTNEDLNIYNGEDFGSAWDKIGIHFSIGQAF